MRTFWMLLLLIVLSLVLAVAAEEEPREAVARDLIASLAGGRPDDVVLRFDATMKEALPPEKLASVWAALESQFGPFVEQGEARIEETSGYEVVFLECRFERGRLDARVVLDAGGRVAGLFFVPARPPADRPAVPPGLADRIVEEEVVVGEGEWTLPGTVTRPAGDGAHPAVVLVHGSGPHDRDETIGPNRPFRDLAHGLAAAGVASLRYDKRTFHHRDRMVTAGSNLTVREETVDDALEGLTLLRSRPGIDAERVFLLGHSLGGALAPRIARQDPAVAGLIILAGPTRPLEDLLVDQLEYLAERDGRVSQEERARIEEVSRARARLRGGPGALDDGEVILGAPASYWKDLRGYRPVQVAASLDRPMLILQGGRDYQVTREDLEGWRRGVGAREKVRLRLYPELNHLFMRDSGRSTPEEYQVEGQVAGEVIRDIAAWILRGELPGRQEVDR